MGAGALIRDLTGRVIRRTLAIPHRPTHLCKIKYNAGTPEGVGPIKPGDKVTAGLEGVVSVSFDVKAAE